MGKLIWHELSRYISLTASVYAVWAGVWGFFFRKFFWDFIGGTLRAPGGLQPSPKFAIFISIIVKLPIVQIVTMVLGFTMIALEYPLPILKGTAIHRSIALRVVLLTMQASAAVLFYQGTNAALWSLIAVMFYIRALTLREKMAEATRNRGRVGEA
ncbi:hypothetical protein DFH29DRAFT_113520 [Suillus ampliporus]|nr:hypothetical protein DFH29DRAFT_113520 [Suillus ampliporus]